MIKGVIFDLDGTTLNTLEDIKDSFNEALRHFNLEEKTMDEIRMGVGRGFRILTDRLLPGLKEELKEEIALYYKQIYSKNYYKKTRPYKGIEELMKTLQEQGIQMAVNSNKSDIFVKDLIARNFPDIKFTDVLGSIEGIPLKPDPEGTYKILKDMSLEKEEVLYIGDSETDMKTAVSAGLKAVGCLWGFRDETTLKENGADYIVSQPSEILRVLKEEL